MGQNVQKRNRSKSHGAQWDFLEYLRLHLLGGGFCKMVIPKPICSIMKMYLLLGGDAYSVCLKLCALSFNHKVFL